VIGLISKALGKVFGTRNDRLLARMRETVAVINSLEERMKGLSEAQFPGKTAEFKRRVEQGESLDSVLPEAFALVREAGVRTLGANKARHYDVQMIGGVTLHEGMIAEMATGEGKTLVATLAAYLNALDDKGVHVVTVNDYLAKRDAEWMGPVYRYCGLSVGFIQADMDNVTRKEAYACDITYGTNNEFGFDYLRDNMKLSLEDQAQKLRHYAIVDEVDSILIDEARTPLIISGPAYDTTAKYYEADRVARMLRKEKHFEVKEKEHSITLLEEGIERAETLAGVDSFYTGANMDWPHLLEQSLRGHHLFRRDRDYIVEHGEVIIVDEFTGRLMHGRHWSDGLHQAVEAKEKLKIKEENQTLATITFQNFFRLYDKLAGMTGTAATEATEFYKIYGLEVVVIPTNRPLARSNLPDVIYRDEKEKYAAIIDEIARVHGTGRPILVGTIAIEKSELLSEMLGRRGIPHDVLNAKQHTREAEIVARAGQMGRVTIATNMAGRGTDIVLGEFAPNEMLEHWKPRDLAPKDLDAIEDDDSKNRLLEHWAETMLDGRKADGSPEEIRARLQKAWPLFTFETAPTGVARLGGLHILGTERHEARRIDNQLRGRAGRQGDPGSSQFFLSMDDDLMRIFGGDRVKKLMAEGQEISMGFLTRAIERAQKRVEERNFDIRKNLLEYDGVMDEQRTLIYSQRQRILKGEGLRELVLEMLESRIVDACERHLSPPDKDMKPDVSGLCAWAKQKFGVEIAPAELEGLGLADVQDLFCEKVKAAYEEREREMTGEAMRELERFVLLQVIDSKWKDHLHTMDQLRSGIGLRSYAQKDPLVAYKKEGYELFDDMMNSIDEEVTGLVFRLRLARSADQELAQSGVWRVADVVHEEFNVMDRQREAAEAASHAGEGKVKTIRRASKKVGRNDPCPCGSGKKYKKCCGMNA
jgi:preprotein translocase subunit SecA